MTDSERDALLKQMAEMMASGLQTAVEPFPETEREFGAIIDELRALAPDDVTGKLVVAGFLDRPWGPEKLRCQECISYLVNRKWCDIPEVSLPAEPDWYCKLWRI
jgi:hypothetical protein